MIDLNELAIFDEQYAAAKAIDNSKLPDGHYTAILKEASLVQPEGKPMRLTCSYIVTDGEFAGRIIFASQQITMDNLGYVKTFIAKHGVEISALSTLASKLSDFSARILQLSLITSRTDARYQNTYIDKYIGKGDLSRFVQAKSATPDVEFTAVADDDDLPFN
ncbi:MAG: hypothetical protein RSF73_05000 [Ruthenibacterium sp.]